MKTERQHNALNYKDICGNNERVWFEMGSRKSDEILFMKWAKSLGCVWLNGSEIIPRNGTSAPYISIHNDGKIACVGMWSWIAWHRKNEKDRTLVVSVEEWKRLINGK